MPESPHLAGRGDRRRPGRPGRRRAPARARLEPLVLEAGDAVGASIREWGHVRVFSPWEFNVDPAAAELLEAARLDRAAGRDGYPTGGEIVERYLEPLAALPAIAPHLRLGAA